MLTMMTGPLAVISRAPMASSVRHAGMAPSPTTRSSSNIDKTCYSIFGSKNKIIKEVKLLVNNVKIKTVNCSKWWLAMVRNCFRKTRDLPKICAVDSTCLSSSYFSKRENRNNHSRSDHWKAEASSLTFSKKIVSELLLSPETVYQFIIQICEFSAVVSIDRSRSSKVDTNRKGVGDFLTVTLVAPFLIGWNYEFLNKFLF